MDEFIIISYFYFKYFQIKLMKEEKVARVCEGTCECTFVHKPKAFTYACLYTYIHTHTHIYIGAHV